MQKKLKIEKNFRWIKNYINRKKHFLKALVLVERIFCGMEKDENTFLSQEDAALSLSYLLSLYKGNDIVPETINDNQPQMAEWKILTDAYKIKQYSLWAFYVDKIDVQIKLIEDKCLIVDKCGILKSFFIDERAFISQRFIRNNEYDAENVRLHSLEQIGSTLSSFVKYNPQRKNYGFLLIKGTFLYLIKSVKTFLQTREIYKEEDFFLNEAFNELHLGKHVDDPFVLGRYRISELISFFRFFRILYNIFDISVYKKRLDKEIVNNSLFIRMKKEHLERILKLFFDFDIKPLLDEVTLDMDNKPCVIDMQYTPLLLSHELYTIPLGIMGNSNFIRNFLKHSQSRVDGDGQVDLIREKYELFIPNCAYGIGYKYKGTQGDLDLVYRIGNTIFISENKNALYGTSVQEKLIALDDVQKARKQKEKFEKNWKDPEFRTLIADKIKVFFEEHPEKMSFDLIGVCDVIFYCTMGSRAPLLLSSESLFIVYIQQIKSFFEGVPISHLDCSLKNIVGYTYRPTFSKEISLFLKVAPNEVSIKKFIEAGRIKLKGIRRA